MSNPRELTTPALAESAPSPDLTGTVWKGRDSKGRLYEFFFYKDELLEYTSPSGHWKNGRWRREKDNIYIDMNDHYSDYRGAIVEDHMSGEAWNLRGEKWTWSMTLVK